MLIGTSIDTSCSPPQSAIIIEAIRSIIHIVWTEVWDRCYNITRNPWCDMLPAGSTGYRYCSWWLFFGHQPLCRFLSTDGLFDPSAREPQASEAMRFIRHTAVDRCGLGGCCINCSSSFGRPSTIADWLYQQMVWFNFNFKNEWSFRMRGI